MNYQKKIQKTNNLLLKLKPVQALLHKEFLIDLRQSAGLVSIFIYLVSILYSTSLLFKNNFSPVSYTALYLILFLFSSLIASYRNFTKEENDNGLFHYIYYSPIQYITGKIIYTIILNILLSLLLLILFILFNGFLIANFQLFVITLLGMVLGVSPLLSLTGSMAGKAQGNFVLMSMMSFPILLPLLIVSAKLCIASIENIPLSMNTKYLISLYSIDAINFLLTFILFSQVWTE
mgnify:CR=1 FL=1